MNNSSNNLCNCNYVLLVLVLIIFQVIVCEGASCHPDDLKVLMQIKDHFKGVYPFSGWNPKLSNDCCNWDVLSCDDDSNSRITGFHLSGMYDDNIAKNVSGEIPRLIGDLPFLETLAVDYLPNLTGTIPSTIANLSNLEAIELAYLNLTGPIPEFLGHIKTLQNIQFVNCGFSGTIPSSLSLLPDIQVLLLSGLNLSGSIPESFGSFKSTLDILRLDTNGLSGPIPKSLGQVNISELELSRNQFTGDASFLFTSDKPLERVILRENHFKFNFSHVNLPWNLNYIDLSYNELYGSLPRQLGQLRHLRYVNFRNNQFTSDKPLERVILRENHFKFNFSHVNLPWNLNYIDLSYNELYGSLPRQLGQLRHLRYVNFRNNQLCGKFPKGRRLKQFSPVGFTDNKCLCDAPGLPPCNK